MAYTYVTGKFIDKDALPSGNAAKVVKGADFEDEFTAIQTAIEALLEIADPTFTGTLTGATINVSGDISCDTIDGGSYT